MLGVAGHDGTSSAHQGHGDEHGVVVIREVCGGRHQEGEGTVAEVRRVDLFPESSEFIAKVWRQCGVELEARARKDLTTVLSEEARMRENSHRGLYRESW